MKKETLEALKSSIKKWKGIVAGTEVDKAHRNCPLCQRFSGGDDNLCYTPDGKEVCPVAEKAENDACEDTPYYAWHGHGVDIHHTTNHPETDQYHRVQPGCPECMRLALDELDFLKRLLPKKSKTKKER